MRNFLKLKHWQLFALLFGLPLVGYIVWIFFFINAAAEMANLSAGGVQPEPGLILASITWVFPIALIVVLVYAGWQWTLAHALHERLPAEVPMRIGLVRAALIYQVAYVGLILVCVYFLFGQIADDPENLEGTFSVVFPAAVLVILLGNLVAIASQFYTYYFNAKALKSVEMGREAVVGDYIGEAALFWVYPIGLWFLQPRVNRLFAD
jgi:hypothetical protein